MNIFNDKEVGIAGDWHAVLWWAEHALDHFAKNGMTLILHLGDFGIWPGQTGEKYLQGVQRKLVENNQTILVTLGNHEDYNQIDAMPVVETGQYAGFKNDPLYPNIYYFARGHKITIGETVFFSMGGANSIDRFYSHRKPNISWWEQEQITLGDVYRAIDAADGGADVMLCHDTLIEVPLFGPAGTTDDSGWLTRDIEYASESRKALSPIVSAVAPKLLLHGHYHFVADHIIEMKDIDGNDFKVRSLGLDKDDTPNNMAIFNTTTKEIDFI